MEIFLWIGFIVLILIFLALDLGVFHRNAHAVSAREALVWTLVWVSVSLIFNLVVYFIYENNWLGIAGLHPEVNEGKDAAIKFFIGYLIEKSLSLDNIFVIAMIFSYFAVPLKHQHLILFWGILGALVFRGIMIIAGAALINEFSWLTYFFGALLLISAVKMLTARHDQIDPYKNPALKFVKRFYKIREDFGDGKFFVYENGKKVATLLFLVLVIIESTDVMFAVDSIPAIFAVTTDPFIVFTSNVFAILGLRSLYFVLAAFIDRFRYLKYSLVFILAFVGVKMLLTHHYKFPPFVSLTVLMGILFIGVVASIVAGKRDTDKLVSPVHPEEEEG